MMMIPRSWLLTLAITVAAVIWMMTGVFTTEDERGIDQTTTTTPLPRVRVQESFAQSMTNRLVLHGQTRAGRTVTIKAETHGIVKEILVEKGIPVNAGEKLIQFAVEERDARLLEAQSLLAERNVEFQAMTSLRKSGYQAETELARAKAALDSATAAVKMAQLELKRIEVTAPIPGIIDSRYVEVGDFINRGDPLAIIVDLDPIRVVAQVSERYLGQVKLNEPGEVKLLEKEIIPARVTFIGSIASESTRTFPVELEIPNPQGLIIQGITAEVRLPIEEIKAHKVPPSVLSMTDQGDLVVKAVDVGNKIVTYPVHILGDSTDSVWLGGLPDELTLVVVGHEFVLRQQAVIPVAVNTSDGK
jgi:multidrug efflux system membrane fusion protein